IVIPPAIFFYYSTLSDSRFKTLQQNPEITLQQLGETFGYNKKYLSNLLKNKTGSSFQELIDQKRLSEAKRLMLETNDSLSTIALKIGYKSVPSIFKLFQKETGKTPDYFRKKRM
ncbi:helix-turn-helix domain-containing protein, partial [Enterococcus hirae]|nr:helix-turn-helix domain-containing protein [Enterococcus hirae]